MPGAATGVIRYLTPKRSAMKKPIKLLLIAVFTVGAVVWFRADRGGQPDQKLVHHVDAMCDIAAHHTDKPKRGLKKMFGYLGKQAPEMMRLFGELLVEIESIPDDARHDERARKAARRFHKHAERCEAPMQKFWSAVEADPEASEIAQRGFERFGRTLEILFGGKSVNDLLPLQL